MKKILFFGILAVAGVLGCKKSNSSPPAPLTWTAGSTVYIVGQDSGRVVYWANGVKTVLAASGGGNGIMLSGSDVYVGGTVYVAGGKTERAAYWKNGTETDLGDTGISWAFQPALKGSDLYVPGYVFGPTPQVYPVYWKNGQRVNLDSSKRGVATGIAISDTDVYIIGQVYDGPFDTSLVWKNGARLDGFYSIEGSPFSQIYAAGPAVYIVDQYGYEDLITWKDAVMTGLSGIFVSGSDIYAAGAVDSGTDVIPAYWKNGTLVKLPGYAHASSTQATGIAVAGPDVYVIGSTYLNYAYKGLVWKNGVLDTLTGDGFLNGVVVQ
jgi:hypothetical protein